MEPDRHEGAYLWIPSKCEQVRAVLFTQDNGVLEGIFNRPEFRLAMSDLGFALVWVTPNIDPIFDFNRGAGERVEALMRALADESGYGELASAPMVPMGFSWHASFPWNFAAWNPRRTLAVISLHGDAPLTNKSGSGHPQPDWGDRSIDGVPGLFVMGEYEWVPGRLQPALDFQINHPRVPLAVVAETGQGHHAFSAGLVSYLGLFLRKAAFYRLPAGDAAGKPSDLLAITPSEGWRIDGWRKDQPARAPAAPWVKYQGDPGEAFWSFDEEMARATEQMQDRRPRLPQLLGFVQNGQAVGQEPGTHHQVTLAFAPEADGVTFHVRGGFIDTVPPGNPEWWTGLPAYTKIGHAAGGGPARVRGSGPVEQINADTWKLAFSRAFPAGGAQPVSEASFIAEHGGDERYRAVVQQARMVIPTRNREGAPQRITFPPIADRTNARDLVVLGATSDAGVPVSYYVRVGPAEIEGDRLRVTDIPPRAKYPIKVTVVAWQYGGDGELRLQTAEPVERSFFIRAP